MSIVCLEPYEYEKEEEKEKEKKKGQQDNYSSVRRW